MMSAIEKTAPMWELPPVLVIRSACRRMRRANSLVSNGSVPNCSGTVERANALADVVDVLRRHHQIHRQHEATLEEPVGPRKNRLETESAELMHRFSSPLDQGSDTACGQIFSQRVAVLGLDLVVLEHVEAARLASGRGRQTQLP